MAQGSGGYGGPNFSQIENSLRNIALSFASIASIQIQLRASVDAWRMLERELVLAQAASEGTRDDFLKMEVAARNFALSTTFSASQVANAFYSLASAGMTAAQALSASNGVIMMAQATLTDLGEAADIVSSTLSQFNLQAAESYRVGNLFVASTNASLSTVPKLAFAMRQVGPIANQMNLSLEQTVGMLDKLFDAGLRGEQAGTALRNVISRLANPVGSARMLMQNLGVTTVDPNTGKLRDVIPMLKDLANLNISIDDAGILSGTEAAAGFLTLLKELKSEAGDTTELEKHIDAITGTNDAYRQSAQMMQTLDGQMTMIGNSFNDMRISLGQMLAPAISGFTSTMVGAAQALREMDDAARLNVVSWALWGVQAVATGKLLINTATGLTAMGASLTQMREAWTLMGTAPNFMARFKGAGPEIATIAKGFGSIAATAAGLFGVAAAVTAIGVAIWKTHKAKQEAKLAEALQGAYQRYADDAGMTGAERARLLDTKDYSAARDQALANLQNQRNVNKDTGTGATAYTQMIYEEMKSEFAFIRTIKQQQDANRKELRANQAIYEKSLAAMAQGRNDWRLLDKVAQGANGKDAVAKYTKDMVAAIDQFTASTDSDLRPAYARMLKAQQAAVMASNAPEGDKRQAYDFLAARLKSASLMDPDTVARLRKEIEDARRAGSADIERIISGKGTIGIGASTGFDRMMRDAIRSTTDAMLPSEEQMAATDADYKQRIREAERRVELLKQRMARDLPNRSREMINQIVVGADITPADAKRIADQINAGLDSGKGPWKTLSDEIIKLGDDREAQIDLIGDTIVREKLISRDKLTKSLERSRTTPIIDPLQLRKFVRDTRIATLEARKALAESLGQGTDLSGFINEIAKERRDMVAEDSLEQLIDTLSKHREGTFTVLANAMQADRQKWVSFFETMINESNDAALNALIENFIASLNMVGMGTTADLFLLIKTQIADAKAKRDQLQAQLNTELRQNRRRSIELTPEQEDRKRLLGLPTEQELYNERRRTLISARYAVSSYLDLPLDAIAQAMEEAELSFREKLVSLQNKYKGFLSSQLTRSEGLILDNPELEAAFSGKLLADAFGKAGKTTFNGKEYTREFLQTADGIAAYISAVEAKFRSTVAGADDANAATEQARRMLNNMAKDVGATIDEYTAQMAVNKIKLWQAETARREFMAQFESQDFIDRVMQELQLKTFAGRPGEISIDLAVNTSVSEVKMDTADALSKLRQKYEELFRMNNLPAVLNSDGKFELVMDGSGGIKEPLVMAADELTLAAGKLSQAADKLSGNTTSAPVAGGSGKTFTSREDAIGWAIRNLEAMGLRVDGNVQSRGGPTTGHANNASHNRFSADVNVRRGVTEADIPQYRQQFDEIARQYQSMGFRVIWNGRVYLPFGNGPGPIVRGSTPGARHTNHLDIHAPEGIVGRNAADNTPPVANDPAIEIANRKRALTNEELEYFEQSRQNYEDERNRLIQLGAAREAFIRDNPIIAITDMAEKAIEAYDMVDGRLNETLRKQNEFTSRSVEAQQSLVSMLAANDNNPLNAAAYLEANMGLQTQRELLDINNRQLEAQRDLQEQIVFARANEDLSKVAELEDLLARVNAQYEKQKELAGSSTEARRDAIRKTMEGIKLQAEGDGFGDNKDIFAGVFYSAHQLAAELPSVFETAANASMQVFNGLSGALANFFTTGGKGAKAMIAQMLASVAQLMAQLVAQAMILQMLSHIIPGFAAVLRVADSAGGLLKAGGKTVNAFAEGGVQMSRRDMLRGGIRGAFNPATALFGEGQYPEAFIPMVDRRSVAVKFDANGNPHVPLPSGETIPVTIVGGFPMVGPANDNKFANGGTMGNVIPWSHLRARQADRATGSSSDAVSPMRQVNRGGSRGDTINQIDVGGIHISLSGGATQEDGDMLAQKIQETLSELLDARDADSAHQRMRSAGRVQNDYYGSM